jgi:hypothetical protein
MAHLGVENPFRQGFLQIIDEPVGLEGGLGIDPASNWSSMASGMWGSLGRGIVRLLCSDHAQPPHEISDTPDRLQRLHRWAKASVWLRVFEVLPEASPASPHLIDSSIVRAHQHAAGGKRGASITPSTVLVED